MPSTDTRIDTNNEFNWSTITTTRDDTGAVTGTSTVYDNGDTSERTDAPGLFGEDIEFFRTTTRHDISDTQNYEYQTIERHIFAPGVLSAGPDDDVIVVSSETLFDDGILVEFDRQVLGDETTTVTTDTADIYDWATITVVEMGTDYVIQGEPFHIRTETVFDDGRTLFETEVPFIHESTVLLDSDGNGLSNSSKFLYADGSVSQESGSSVGNVGYTIRYNESGVMTSKDEFDSAYDVRNFERRLTQYDDDGTLVFRGTLYDTGILRQDVFENGVIATTTTTDETDIANYQTRTDTFDATGVLEQRLTVGDDGVIRDEEFENGVRTTTITTDEADVADYQFRVENYDAAGVLEQRLTVGDDGVEREENFVDGQRVQISFTDTRDVQSYDTITTTFDLEANTETKITEYDDGRSLELIKEDGVNRLKTEIDQSEDGAAFNYETRVTTYDENGAREQVKTNLDLGDQFVFNYVDGALTQRVEFDGDESHDWTFKVTEYNDATAPVVTFYDDFSDAPIDVLEDFGFLTV